MVIWNNVPITICPYDNCICEQLLINCHFCSRYKHQTVAKKETGKP